MATQAQKLKILSTDEKFDYIVNKLEKIDGRLEGVEKRLDKIESRLDNIEDTISKIKIVIPVPIENAELLTKLQTKLKKKG